MGKTTPSRHLLLVVWTSFIVSIISATSISLRPCSDTSPAGKRKPCLTQLPEEECQGLLADTRLQQTMNQTIKRTREEVNLTSAGCEERSRREKFQLHWKTSHAKRRGSCLIILRVERKEGYTVSCYQSTKNFSERGRKRPRKKKKKRPRQRRAAKGKQTKGRKKQKGVSAELSIDEDYTKVRAFILETPKSARKLKSVLRHNLSTAKSVEYIPRPPEEVKLSDLDILPPNRCKSLYTDGQYKHKSWPNKAQVNLIPRQDARHSIPHNFFIQCNASDRDKGYLIVAQVYEGGSTLHDASRCFYFSPQKNQTCKKLRVPLAFDVKGNYSKATVGILQGVSLKKPEKYFKNQREFTILEHFNEGLGQVHYDVPSPPSPPTAPVQSGQSCYSWKPSGRIPHNWHITNTSVLLEVHACPINQLAHSLLLYLTPCHDHTHSVSKVPLSQKTCAGNLTVPTNNTYGNCWTVMLTWDCFHCPEEGRLNGGGCRSKFLIFDDNLSVPREPVDRRRQQEPWRCKAFRPIAVNPWMPASNSVLPPQESVLIIYWRDHELHLEATRQLAAMLRNLGLKVAIDVDSAEDIRRGGDHWLNKSLNSSSSIIIVASNGLLQACRRRLDGRENSANNSYIYGDLAPAALQILRRKRMSSQYPRGQQVILVSFGYDSTCLAGLHSVLFNVFDLRKVVLAARPPKDETDRTEVPKSTEIHADLYGFFFQLTGCRGKAESVAQSEQARLFEKARLEMQRVRAQCEDPVLAQSASLT